MSIIKVFKKAMITYRERGWDTLYVAIDMHDTICKSTYREDNIINYYPHAKDILQKMGRIPFIKTILYTSTPDKRIKEYLEMFAKDDIKFDFINSNPDVENTAYGDFSIKPYFNVLMDDKAGFDPENDWLVLVDYFKLYN